MYCLPVRQQLCWRLAYWFRKQAGEPMLRCADAYPMNLTTGGRHLPLQTVERYQEHTSQLSILVSPLLHLHFELFASQLLT